MRKPSLILLVLPEAGGHDKELGRFWPAGGRLYMADLRKAALQAGEELFFTAPLPTLATKAPSGAHGFRKSKAASPSRDAQVVGRNMAGRERCHVEDQIGGASGRSRSNSDLLLEKIEL